MPSTLYLAQTHLYQSGFDRAYSSKASQVRILAGTHFCFLLKNEFLTYNKIQINANIF
jgi:hypothetical protein